MANGNWGQTPPGWAFPDEWARQFGTFGFRTPWGQTLGGSYQPAQVTGKYMSPEVQKIFLGMGTKSPVPPTVTPEGATAGTTTQPTEPPVEGYEWSWDAGKGKWRQTYTGAVPPQPLPEGYVWQKNEVGAWEPVWIGTETTSPYQWAQLQQGQQQWQGNLDWQKQQYQQEMALNQQQLAWQQQQVADQLAAQREQQLATLRAQPESWLEYNLLAGQTPAIQPWMLPLMPQQYQGVQAGGAIPGWQPPLVPESVTGYINRTGANFEGEYRTDGGWISPTGELPVGYTGYIPQGAPNPRNMPALTTPSTQYLARMGPTAQSQYGGYERARTGMTPEEMQMRLWSQAPPSGQYGGLAWQR